MTRPETLAWLEALQARFGGAIRTPLIVRTGGLHANVAAFGAARDDIADATPSGAADRLAVYNRQYWLRVLRTMQNDFPLCAGLLSPWFFNQTAMRFLLAHPPRSYSLEHLAVGFEAFLESSLTAEHVQLGTLSLPRTALLEAARLDATYRRVFIAPEQPRFALTHAFAPAAASQRLRFSAAYARFEEHWPLVRLRHDLLGTNGETAVPLPAALPTAQTWALFRTPRGVVQLLLEPRQAQLLALLERHTLDAALGELEASCDHDERRTLPERTRRWLTQAVELRLFSGFCSDP